MGFVVRDLAIEAIDPTLETDGVVAGKARDLEARSTLEVEAETVEGAVDEAL